MKREERESRDGGRDMLKKVKETGDGESDGVDKEIK
jgi:hypothetical protein